MLRCVKVGRRPSQAARSTLVVAGDNRSKRTAPSAVRSLLMQVGNVARGEYETRVQVVPAGVIRQDQRSL